MGKGFDVKEGLHKASDSTAIGHSDASSQPTQITPAENKEFVDKRNAAKDVPAGFKTPNIFDSEKLHPQEAFSPEGPPAKLFDGLGANGHRVEDGVLYATNTDADGTQHRVIRDSKNDTRTEDIVRPDGTTASIKSEHNKPGSANPGGSFREVKEFNVDGTLKTHQTDDLRQGPGMDSQNLDSHQEFDHGRLIMNNNRWQSKDGQWHENNWMKDSEGTTYSQVMDGNTTTKRRTTEDGRWTQTVITRGEHDMSVVYSSSDKP